jgi:endonuclease/exonuclease/phosphatase family metal-dependent hydrolase
VNADQTANTKTIKVMTYNLRYASGTFKPPWAIRREMQVDMFRKYSPDIIGTQEGVKEQIDYLMKQLPEYVVIGEGRRGGDNDEHNAIFFKRDRFRLREMGSFALSETPDILGSGPDRWPRMVTWARFAFIDIPDDGETGAEQMQDKPFWEDSWYEDSTGKILYRRHWENTLEFYVFNTHFFTRGKDKGKRNSAKLIMERIKELDNFGEWKKERPVFLVGDFNSRPGSDVYKIFTGDENSEDPSLLKDSVEGGSGIDWILYKGNVKVLSYENIDHRVDGARPSDHRPILVEFEILHD